MAPVPRSPVERFWSYAERGSDQECWIWQGHLSTEGYGEIRLGGRGSKRTTAHRFAYELLAGPIPAGLHLDHLCRNRACVNPAHLEPVTCRENILRGVSPSAGNATKTQCIHGHEFTPENTMIRPSGRRGCRACYEAWLTRRRLERQSECAKAAV